MQLDFKNKTIIVTGSARGIGKSIAMQFAAMGGNIVINDIEPAKEFVDSTVNEIKSNGGNACGIIGSVASMSDAENLISETVKTFGSVDVLINNAGVTRDNLIMRMSEDDWDLVLDINLKGAFNMIKAASKVMLKARKGSIVNISSVVGVMGNAGQANYSASKAGLIGLTKSVAKEFASRGVTCNAVAPGFINTAMTDKLSDDVKESYLSGIPLKKFGATEDIANTVAYLSSDYAKYITGQVINVDGGLVM